MPIFPTRTHAVLDYFGSVALILFPLLFMVNSGGRAARTEQGADIVVTGASYNTAAWVIMGAGIATLVVNLLTRHELGVRRLLPMEAHLAADGIIGLFLIASPWLLGFAHMVWWPHVLLGLAGLAFAARTERRSRVEEEAARRRAAARRR